MSIRSEIDRIKKAKAAIRTSITGKGVAVPEATKIEGLSSYIDKIAVYPDGENVKFGPISSGGMN